VIELIESGFQVLPICATSDILWGGADAQTVRYNIFWPILGATL